MKALLLVGIGGGIGSIMRYLTTVLISRYSSSLFPWATYSANLLGCLLIGLFIGILERQQVLSSDLKLLLITGFCGGYTTFSAFANENMTLIRSGHTFTALLYIAVSVLSGILAVYGGMLIAKSI